MEIIKLNGSVELGPLTGLSDAIIDIVESGRTLKENDWWSWMNLPYKRKIGG